MNQKILKIPYSAVNGDWNLLQKFLTLKGNPRYILVGDVDLHNRRDISDLVNLVGMEGNLNLTSSTIESLGDLEFVNGYLDLFYCQNIKTLGKLKKVDGYLSLSSSSVKSLGELEFVGKDMWLTNCKKIQTLGNFKRVEGTLRLSRSRIQSLGDLEFIGGNLWVDGTKIPPSELDNVEIIGKIYR
jgi:hypothetical protein